MKRFLFLMIMIASVHYGFGQSLGNWQTTSEKNIQSPILEKEHMPKSFHLFHLNTAKLLAQLTEAPMRGELQKHQGLILEFPNAQGQLERFSIIEAPTLHPDLSKKYDGIKSYAGQGIDDPTAVIRFSISHLGFHGMIMSANKSTCFIDPHTIDRQSYIVYAKKDISAITNDFACYTEQEDKPNTIDSGFPMFATDDSNLRKYRLALSCTAEYGNIFAGSGSDAQKKANILAQMNITMTRVNGVYEKDLAITMEIIPNNDILIYYGSTNSDPWGNEWNNTTQNVIDNAIGDANYDIGHNFNTTGGGNAGCIGCVCSSGNKGSAYTGRANPTGDPFDIDYVAHEIGHQFGGYHTQSNQSCRSGSGNTEVEPGSASTIMGYAGICSANVQNNSDDYFNYVNIRDISNNVQSGTSSSCAEIVALSNNAPTANAGANYTIPKSTAFVLRGQGSDPDGNASLTYTWEQNDPENPGSNSAPSPTRTVGPMFRSIKGGSSPDRYMPRIQDVVNNNLTPTWEVVPSVARNMEFALTVRDNNAGGGQTADDLMQVTVNGNSGPFLVNSPNTTLTWNVGSTQTVTWDVANTNSAPVNCNNVNILLSTDGGFTYPITLIANTPNDGSQNITVPNNLSTTCRVMVEAADNIFYDISNNNFTIEGQVDCNVAIPSGVNISNINATSATISWNAIPGATYDVRYRAVGTTTWSSINNIGGTSTIINGLTPLTDYEAQVRSICPDDVSAYSNTVNFSTIEVQIEYCNSTSTNATEEYISNVQLENINNSSGGTNYSDFTNISTDLEVGNNYTITITPTWTGTTYNEAYAVWIDFNKDGDFADAGELVWSLSPTQNSPVSGTISIPQNSTPQSTRMRVSMKYNDIPDPCETFTYGEVEDYTVNIVAAGCPSAGTPCDDENPATFNDVEDGNCNCEGTPCPTAGTSCDDGNPATFDDVEDGNCNCEGTPCPTAGTSCDDGNPATINDIEDGNCNCEGTLCPTAGTACDDGNPATFNDVEDGNCNCEGTPCPTAGTSCDDGNPATFNDVEDGNCNCEGTPCPTAGTACDDGNPATFDDVEDGNCNCEGTPCPTAGTACDDGNPATFDDIEDGNCNCEGTPCPTAGTACDDGNPATTNDVEDGNCNCEGTPIPTCDDGIQNGQETGIDCGGPDCVPCATCENVTLSITLDNYPGETTWTLTNTNGTTIASGGNYSGQSPGTVIEEEFCLDTGCYTFTINDSYGDGICCGYGNGSYSLVSDAGTILASGGQFNSTESTDFCTDNYQATCDDGMQNGDETGIDCGGSDCAPCPLEYCDSQSNNASEEYISRVQLVGIDNPSGSATYSDFTAISTTLVKGNNNTITVTPTWTGNVYPEAYAVWIDLNQDGDFSDSGERVWKRNATTNSPVSGSFTIPNTATNGNTRMRVSMKYNGVPGPCQTFNYGEVEDYTVTIVDGNNNFVIANDTPTPIQWSIYPNPTTDYLTVSWNMDKMEANAYIIRDITGRIVQQAVIGDVVEQRINLTDLRNGSYFITLIAVDGSTNTKRFIKQ